MRFVKEGAQLANSSFFACLQVVWFLPKSKRMLVKDASRPKWPLDPIDWAPIIHQHHWADQQERSQTIAKDSIRALLLIL